MDLRTEAARDLSRPGAGLLVCVAICLALLGTVTLDHVKYRVLVEGMRPAAGALLASLRMADLLLVGALVASAVAALWLEWKRGAVSSLWQGRHPVALALVATALIGWLASAVLGAGLLTTGDAGTHVARVSHLTRAIQDNHSLFWDNGWFAGSTLLQFTGPLFHWIAAAINLAVGDATTSIKLTILLGRLVAGFFFYRLMVGKGVSAPIACLGAVVYAGAYFVTYMASIRSSFPQIISFAAMPAVLFFIDRILARPAILTPAVAGLALSTIAMVANHQPTALMFALPAAIYTIVGIVRSGRGMAALVPLATGIVAAGVGSLYFLVPFALERGMTADNFPADNLISAALPTGSQLWPLVIWRAVGVGPDYAAWAGAVVWIGIVAGLALLPRRRQGAQALAGGRWFLVLCGLAILAVFLRGAYVRHLTITFLFMTMAATIGLAMLAQVRPQWKRLPTILLAIVVLDLGPLSIQPWSRPDYGAVVDAGTYLEKTATRQRVLDIRLDGAQPMVSVDPALTPLHYSRAQILMGPHKQDASPPHNALAGVMKLVEADLRRDGRIGADVRAMLESLNVGWVVGVAANRMGLPDSYPDTRDDPVVGRMWRLPHATPILVSGTLARSDLPATPWGAPAWNFVFDGGGAQGERLKQMAAAIHKDMMVEPADRRAGRFLVPAAVTLPAWARVEAAPAPVVALLSYAVPPDRVSLTLEADRAGFVRLAHPVSLGLRVVVNGQAVTPIGDAMGMVVLPIQAGRSAIELSWHPSPLRQACLWVSAGTVALLLGLAIVGGLRRSQTSPDAA